MTKVQKVSNWRKQWVIPGPTVYHADSVQTGYCNCIQLSPSASATTFFLRSRTTPSFAISKNAPDFRSCSIFFHPADARQTLKHIPKSSPAKQVAPLRAPWRSRDWRAIVTALTYHAQQPLSNEVVVGRKQDLIGARVDQSEATALLAFCWRYNCAVPGQVGQLKYSVSAWFCVYTVLTISIQSAFLVFDGGADFLVCWSSMSRLI